MNEIAICGFNEELITVSEFGEYSLENTPYCHANLELIEIANGLEFILGKAQIFEDLTLKMRGSDSALILSTMLMGQGIFQKPSEPAFSLLQTTQQITLAYHPEMQDIVTFPSQQNLTIAGYGITPLFLEKILAGNPLPKSLETILNKPDEAMMLFPTLQFSPKVKDITQQIVSCPYHGIIKTLFLEAKALELLAIYLTQLEEYEISKQNISLKSQDINLIYQAQEYLLSKKQQPPTLVEIAHQVGLNQEKLKRGFKEIFGTTVFGYLRDCRLNEAYQLIVNTQLSIQMIAEQVGYLDSKYFAKVFKAKFGKNPSELRK